MGNTDIEDLKNKNAIDRLYFLKDTNWVFQNYESIVNDSLLEIHTNIDNDKYNIQELEKILGILGIFKKKGLNVADPKFNNHNFMNVNDIEQINNQYLRILDFNSDLWDDAALKTEIDDIIKKQNFGIYNPKILISSIIGRRTNDILAILPDLITLYKNKKAAGPSASEAQPSASEAQPSASEAQPSASEAVISSEAQPSANEEANEAVLASKAGPSANEEASEAEPRANEEAPSSANEEEILPPNVKPTIAQQQSGLWQLVDNRWRKKGTFIQLDPNAGPISGQEAGKRKRKTRKYKKKKTLRKRKSLRKRKTLRRKNKRKTLRRN